MSETQNELRESEIDSERERFEVACSEIIARLTGWDDIANGAAFCFNYDDVSYSNTWTDACWQSYIKGRFSTIK